MTFRDSRGSGRTDGVASVMAVIGATLVAIMASCATVPSPAEFDTATLHGMIYDEEHRPVRWASVSIAGGDPVYTDIEGRFAVPDVPRGIVSIEVGRDEFAPHAGEFLFANRTQVLYLRLHSGRDFLRQAIGSLESGAEEAAIEPAREGLMVLPGDPEARFIAALASYLIGDLTAALTHLSGFPETCGYEAVTRLRADIVAAVEAE